MCQSRGCKQNPQRSKHHGTHSCQASTMAPVAAGSVPQQLCPGGPLHLRGQQPPVLGEVEDGLHHPVPIQQAEDVADARLLPQRLAQTPARLVMLHSHWAPQQHSGVGQGRAHWSQGPTGAESMLMTMTVMGSLVQQPAHSRHCPEHVSFHFHHDTGGRGVVEMSAMKRVCVGGGGGGQ